jgi:hypothetical protein
MNVKQTLSVTGESGVSTATGYTALMQKSGEPCEFKGQTLLSPFADGCGVYGKTSYDYASGSKFTDLNIKINNGLSAQVGDTFYSTGYNEITFNDWTGKMTYEGANIAPKYEVTNGTVPVPITGTYTPVSSGSRGNGMRMMHHPMAMKFLN